MANSKPSRDPLYQNWIKAGLALKFGKDAISVFLGTVLEQFRLTTLVGKSVHSGHTCTLLNIVPCYTNGFCYGGNNCKKHDTTDVTKTHRPCPHGVCDKLYNAIKSQFASAKGPSWSQSDPTLWCSNVWEIAKCFMPVGYENKHNIDEYDFSGIMSLVINCKFIQDKLSKPYDLGFFQKLRDIRNTVMHSGNYSLTDDERKTYCKLIQDMVEHVLNFPLEPNENEIYYKIQQLVAGTFCATTQDELNFLYDTISEISLKVIAMNEILDENCDNKAEIQFLKERIQALGEPIPPHIKTRHDIDISHWRDNELDFVETRAAMNLSNLAVDEKAVCCCVVVVGAAGSGKTTLIQHEALRLQQENNFELVPMSKPEDIDLYHNGSRHQVFVFDDCFGDTYLNRVLVDKFDNISRVLVTTRSEIEKPGQQMDNQTKKETDQTASKYIKPENEKPQTILLMSSRLHIYNEVLRINTLGSLNIRVCDLTVAENCLNEVENLKLLEHYIPEHANEVITEIEINEFFPLICKLARGQNMDSKQLCKFFMSPIEHINKDIYSMKEKRQENNKFCCLCMCVLFSGRLDSKWLIDPDCIRDTGTGDAFREVLDQFGLKPTRDTDLEAIRNGLHDLQKTYTKCENNIWSLIHNKINEQCAKSCGDYLFRTFLKHSNAEFISQKYVLERIKTEIFDEKQLNVTDMTIFQMENLTCIDVCETNEGLYVERLKKDMLSQNVTSMFENRQMPSKIFRGLITSEIQNDGILQQSIKSTQLNSTFRFLASDGYSDVINLLLSIGCKIDVNEVLFIACDNGHCNVIRELTHLKDFDVNCINFTFLTYYGKTPLQVACQGKHVECVKYLLSSGAEVNVNLTFSDNHDYTPLMIACENGNIEIISLLLEYGADINCNDKYVRTPLVIACKRKDIECVKCLLSAGADVNVNSLYRHGKTCIPLIHACESGDVNIVSLLIGKCADVNAKDDEGNSPLMLACKGKHIECVKCLLLSGSEVNVTSTSWPFYGFTPLMVACHLGDEAIVSLLIENDADVNFEVIKGRTPLLVACKGKHIECVKYLLSFGAEVDVYYRPWPFVSYTPLLVACESGDIDLLTLLVKHGADINYNESNLLTPLIVACNGWLCSPSFRLNYEDQTACQCKHVECVKYLLSEGADVNLTSKSYGYTPLMYACKQGNTEVVSLLIANGANVNIKGKYSDTALSIAIYGNHVESVKYLVSKGADVNGTAHRYGAFAPIMLPLDNFVKHIPGVEIVDDTLLFGCHDYTPLMYACENGYTGIVSILTEEGADVNVSDNRGVTSLMYACIFDDKSHDKDTIITSYMYPYMDKGFNYDDEECVDSVESENKEVDGVESGNKEVDSDESGNKEVDSVESENKEVDSDESGNKEVDGVESGNKEVDSVESEHKEVDSVESEHKEVDSDESENIKHTIIATRLIDKGADIDARDEIGTTALIHACMRKNKTMVSLLIEKGADVNVSDYTGGTALIYARQIVEEGHNDMYNNQEENIDIVSLLLEHGAV